MKLSAPIEGATASQLKSYADLCGWTLARAHAKSGDASTISGYLGKGDRFDKALEDFSILFADQNEKDYAVLVKAERKGKIKAIREEEV
jgi:hypothetical protein